MLRIKLSIKVFQSDKSFILNICPRTAGLTVGPLTLFSEGMPLKWGFPCCLCSKEASNADSSSQIIWLVKCTVWLKCLFWSLPGRFHPFCLCHVPSSVDLTFPEIQSSLTWYSRKHQFSMVNYHFHCCLSVSGKGYVFLPSPFCQEALVLRWI